MCVLVMSGKGPGRGIQPRSDPDARASLERSLLGVSLNSVFSGLYPIVLDKHVIYPLTTELKQESNRNMDLQDHFKLAKQNYPTSSCSILVCIEKTQLDCAPILQPQLSWALALAGTPSQCWGLGFPALTRLYHTANPGKREGTPKKQTRISFHDCFHFMLTTPYWQWHY